MVVEARIAAARGWLPGPAARPPARRCCAAAALPVTPATFAVAVSAERVVARDGEGAADPRRAACAGCCPLALGETVIADDVTEDELRAALPACGVRLDVK